MRKMTEFILKRPIAVIGATILITLFMGIFIKDVWFDNDVSHLIPDKNSDNVFHQEIKDTFGSQGMIFIEFLRDDETGIFNYDTLKRIERISHVFEGMEYADDVLSVAVSNNIVGDEVGMSVGPVWEEGTLDASPGSISRIKDDVYSNPLYIKSIVSEDGKAASIIIKLDEKNIENTDDDTAYEDYLSDTDYYAGLFSGAGLLASDPVTGKNSVTLKLREGVSQDSLITFMCDNAVYSNKFFTRTEKRPL